MGLAKNGCSMAREANGFGVTDFIGFHYCHKQSIFDTILNRKLTAKPVGKCEFQSARHNPVP
jgi:hypothetical protein